MANIRAARAGEDGNLHWEWTDDVDWEPQVSMAMSAGDGQQVLPGQGERRDRARAPADQVGRRRQGGARLMPITKPVFARYRAMLEAEYPHLVV